jgi:hypothetical protein
VKEPPFTSRILKAGAALDDTRRVVEIWDSGQSAGENLRHISDANPLGKASRMRLDDVLYWAIKPRYVEPGTHIIPALKRLLPDPHAFTDACYFETTRCDALLAAFAERAVSSCWRGRQIYITVGDAGNWLERQLGHDRISAWSPSVRLRVAQGLLSALRDFGILRGAARSPRKEIVAPAISVRGFAYAAWRNHELGASSHSLVHGPAWNRWLLDTAAVLSMFDQVARLGLLRISSAGSVVRIDWLARSLAEVTSAAAQRAQGDREPDRRVLRLRE